MRSGVIKDRSVDGVKLKNTVTALEIAPNAVGNSELADNSVDEDAVQVRQFLQIRSPIQRFNRGTIRLDRSVMAR